MKLPHIDWDRFFTRAWSALGSLPQIQFRVVVLAILDFITMALAWKLAFTEGASDDAVFNAWLVFLAGLHGVNLTAFAVKRSTFKPGSPDAGGPPGQTFQPPPQPPAPIIVAPAGPTVTTTTQSGVSTTPITAPGVGQ